MIAILKALKPTSLSIILLLLVVLWQASKVASGMWISRCFLLLALSRDSFYLLLALAFGM